MKAGLLDRLTGRHTRQGLWVLPALIALAIAIVLALQAPDFLGADNVFNLVAQTMPLMITAVGQMFVVIIGGLDLSVGSLISLTTAVLALDEEAMRRHRPITRALAAELFRAPEGA